MRYTASVDLSDAMLLLSVPDLSERVLILAAKVAARELERSVIATDEGVWRPESLLTDGEFLEFGLALRGELKRKPEPS
jgi:hypothetical protein